MSSYLAAANDEDLLVADLPGEDEGPSALDFWELRAAHSVCGLCRQVQCHMLKRRWQKKRSM